MGRPLNKKWYSVSGIVKLFEPGSFMDINSIFNKQKAERLLTLAMSFIRGFIMVGIIFDVFVSYKNILTVFSLLVFSPIISYLLIKPDLFNTFNRARLITFVTGQSLAMVLFLTAFCFSG
ncbi:hypothetical protein GFC01_06135 [Desulfofundulus thermobenzoicus]|uniref:Uncharacterized protein n=1 Tax=Desulfofundulus thermobenzoicus TaxID=29376 RepID=A0A6N7IQM6_9FIRM|nr:hypothetical protein [Desulfofundulus thermobenzoicus]MQL51849.1 hypothetical protein [Desulfofundulus thermobenzoicus]